MGQTYYFSDLIKQHGIQRAQEEAKNLNNRGNTVIVDAESIIDREPDMDTARDTLQMLTKKGYKVRVNLATLQRDAGENASSVAEKLKSQYQWDVYDARPKTRQEVIGLPMESAHKPVAPVAPVQQQATPVPPPATGLGMRAATPEEAKAAMQPMQPVNVPSRTLQESAIEPGVFRRPAKPPEGVAERTAQRFADSVMGPMGAAIGLVSDPEQYWTASKSLTNLLANATGQAANALGLGDYKYSDFFKSQSQTADEELRKVLSPIGKAATTAYAIPMAGLGMVSAVTRGLTDIATTALSGNAAGEALSNLNISQATTPGQQAAAAVVDPLGSAFETVSNIAKQGYLSLGGSEETAAKFSELAVIGVLAAFHSATREALERTQTKIAKSEPLGTEEKQMVDQVGGPEKVPEAIQVIDANNALLGHLRDWQILQNAKKQAAIRQSFQGGPEEVLIGHERVPGTNQILEVYDAEGIGKKTQGRGPQEGIQGSEGGQVRLRDVAENRVGAVNAEKAVGQEVASAQEVIHQMPTGETMAGPEHPGAVPGSTEVKPVPDVTKEHGGFADPIAVVINLFRRPARTEGVSVAFEDPSLEQKFQEAKGIQSPTIRQKVTAAINKIRLQRWGVKEYDPRQSPEHAANYEILRQYQAAPERASLKAHDIIGEATKGLKKDALDFMTKILMLRDLKYDIETGKYEGKELPFGLKDAGQLEGELGRMEGILADPRNASVQNAIELRNDLTRQVTERMVELGLLPESVLAKDSYFHHQVLKYYNQTAPELGGKRSGALKERGFGAQKARVGSAESYNTNFVESEFGWLRDALEAIYTRETFNRIKELNDISDTVGKTEGKVIPDGYVKYNIEPNHKFYRAFTLSEKLLDRVLSGEVKKEDLKQGFAARSMDSMIIPKDLANTLNHFKDANADNVLGAGARKINSGYKVWTLFNPYRVVKYMLNNLSGDADIVVAAQPGVLKYAKKATQDLFNQVYRLKYNPKFKAEYDEMVGTGVGGGGLTMQEIPDINQSAVLQGLTRDPVTLKDFAPRMAKGYWRGVKELNNFRENILRLSAFRFYKDALAKGERPYGVSNRVQMKQLYEAMDRGLMKPNEVAAKLARNLMGDYGDVSQAGQWIRQKAVPFYSWVEINAPRYYNLIRNIAAESGAGKNATIARTAGVAAKTALSKTAQAALLMHGMYALVNIWNRSFFPQEDEQINKDKKELYLITGRNEDGTVNKLRFSGALTDALELFGLRNLFNDVDDIKEGKKELKDVLWEVPTGAAESMLQRVNPIYKAPVEMLTGRSLYPKIFQDRMPKTLSINQFLEQSFSGGREIRDRAEFMARVASMDWLYRKVAKIPEANFDTPIEGLVFTKTDPGQAAYYRTKEMVYDWLKRTGRERPGPSRADDKANALFYYKMALQYKRPDLADHWEKRYYELDGTPKGLARSVALSSPLGQLGKGDDKFFYDQLTGEEARTIKLAEEWYEKTVR